MVGEQRPKRDSGPRKMGLLDMFRAQKPEEAVKKWQAELRNEMRAMDRQILGARVEREQKKVSLLRASSIRCVCL